MRAHLIYSPSAGNGGPSQDELLAAFRQAGFQPSSCSVKDPSFPDVLSKPTDLIVAVGGDGTVTTVLTSLPDRKVPVTIVPQGTANNIARSLGIEGSPDQIAAGLRDARERPFDIGVATGPWGCHRFIEAVGVGLLAQAMAEIDAADISGAEQLRSSRREFGRKLAEAEPEHLDVTVDGHELTGDFLIFEVMNIGYVGPNLNLAPMADPGDGLLDVVYAPVGRRAGMQEWLETDPERTAPPVEVMRARKVELGQAGTTLRLGDNFSPAPGVVARMTLELEPEPVRLLVPRQSS